MTPNEPQAPAASDPHSVTGNCCPELEALKPWPLEDTVYGDDVVVGTVTDWLQEQGCTVFQTFMLDPDEGVHSRMVLERTHIPERGRVISLGCGIGGMERYWTEVRPDIEVTLVNASMAQLARCVCPGPRVLADMTDGPSLPGLGGYDLAVMAYSLHHCPDVLEMLATARTLLRQGGALLVLDVVDGGPAYHDVVQYRTPRSFELQCGGLVALRGVEWHRQPVEVIGAHVHAVLDRDPVRPGMWLGMA